MTQKDRAVENLKSGLNCAQSVLSAYGEILGLDGKYIKAVSSGFGKGMGGAQKTCGAVSGAIMVIGSMCYDEDNFDHNEKTWKGLKRSIIAPIVMYFWALI